MAERLHRRMFVVEWKPVNGDFRWFGGWGRVYWTRKDAENIADSVKMHAPSAASIRIVEYAPIPSQPKRTRAKKGEK